MQGIALLAGKAALHIGIHQFFRKVLGKAAISRFLTGTSGIDDLTNSESLPTACGHEAWNFAGDSSNLLRTHFHTGAHVFNGLS